VLQPIYRIIAASAFAIAFLFGFAGSLQAGCTTTSGVTTCTQANGQLVWQSSNGEFTPYGSSMTVSGVTGPVASVTVTLNSLSFTDGEDILIMLVGPNGNNLQFLAGPCGGGVSGTGTTLSGTFTFSDAAGASFQGQAEASPACTTYSSGTYKPYVVSGAVLSDLGTLPSPAPSATNAAPAGSSSFNTQFFGMSAGTANGTWTLYAADVSDNFPGTTTSGHIGAGSGSSPWTLTITAGSGTSTTTTVSSNLNPSFTAGASSAVTLTATVTSTSTVSGGTVAFFDGVSALTCSGGNQTVSSGSATCQFTFTTEGAHVITADYGGGGSFAGSNSAALTQVVNTHSTTQSSPPGGTVGFCNPGTITIPNSGVSGDESVTGAPANPYASEIFVSGLTGVVNNLSVYLNGFSHASPNGTGFLLAGPNGKNLDFFSEGGGGNTVSGLNLIFSDNGTSLTSAAQVPTSGSTYMPVSFASGQATVYCQSAACNGVTISEAAPATIQSAAPRGGSGGYPGPGTFLGQFAGSNPNGTWQLFTVNRLAGLTGSVSGGWCVNFTLGTGDPTSTTLTSSLNPSYIAANGSTADSVTFTATVVDQNNPGGQINQGTVTFTSGATILGTGSVAFNGTANVATFATSSPTVLPEGTHNIVATYDGTSSFGTSVSNTVVQTVYRHSTISFSGSTYTFCNTGGVTVPAGGSGNPLAAVSGPYPSNIFVASLPGVTNLVTLNLNNYASTLPNDFDSLLVGPAGTGTSAIDFFSRVGGTNNVSNVNLTFADAAGSSVGTLTSSTSPTVRMTSGSGTSTWPGPAPGSFVYAAPQGSALLSVFNSMNSNGTWSLYMQNTVNGAYGGVGAWCTNLTQTPPVLSVVKSAGGVHFRQGQQGAQYTFTVTNNGPGPTGDPTGLHPAAVADVLPSGLTFASGSGTGWSCGAVAQTVTCTSEGAIASGSSYPTLTVNVNVAGNAGATVINQAAVSGGGSTGSVNSNSTTTTVDPASDLTVSKGLTGSLIQGQTAIYPITVSNIVAGSVTLGQATVTDTPPAGFTYDAAASTPNGWACALNSGQVVCTITQVVSGGSAYPVVTLAFDIASGASGSATNNVVVSGGGEVNTANDSGMNTATIVQTTATAAANATAPFSASNQSVTLNATVSTSPGTVNTGTVTFTVKNGGTTIGSPVTSGTVAAGAATANFTLPGGTAVGPYTIQAVYNPGSGFTTSSDSTHTLTVTAVTVPAVVSYNVLWGSESYNVTGTSRNRLPWQIAGIQVVFSEAITSGNVNSLSGAGVTTTGFSGLGTNTLTWTISPLALGSFSTALAGSGANALKDAGGNALGSGTGFSQNLKILYGDFNDDGVVNSQDLALVNAARTAAYNILADLNGDGVVDANDVQIVRNRQGTSLP
jgi:hypothetical protein